MSFTYYSGFIQYLGVHGWQVDTEVDASISHEIALEDSGLSREELDQSFNDKLKDSSESKRALILRISHIGGHRYAGNCIVRPLKLHRDIDELTISSDIHSTRFWCMVRESITA